MSSKKRPELSRRSFLKVAGGIAIGSRIGIAGQAHARSVGAYATLIDLSLCDGCPDRDTPACVEACRKEKTGYVPDPVNPIPELFPRGMIEDWSRKKGVKNRLTPYNLTFVQTAEVEHQGRNYSLHIPRRCMHCDNPACATICPFSANHKYPTGAVVIDKDLCFGGAKCRTVCPWAIPQRQSGIGIYLDIAPTLAGNGVMFKCDLCQDRLIQGREPACIEACPQKALLIGPKEEIHAEAEARRERMNGYIYGEKENGGTATLYVSPVPFDKLNTAIEKGPGKPHLQEVQRSMADTDSLGRTVLLTPLIGLAAGIAAVRGSLNRKDEGPEKDKDDE